MTNLSIKVPKEPLAPDCRHYRGIKPCLHNRLCAGCGHYRPFTHRVCVIKLGALGDVIRTLCLLPELRRRWPEAQITWVSEPAGCRMIEGHPEIDRVVEFNALNGMVLSQERFDLVISLDKEPEPCALAGTLHATQKLGIGLGTFGTPVPMTPEAEHYFCLGVSDELKFEQNDKSYPRLIYEALGFEYAGQSYTLPLSQETLTKVGLALQTSGWRAERRTLGINVGAGHRFANKMWPLARVVELIDKILIDTDDVQILLLGGAGEQGLMDALLEKLTSHPAAHRVVNAGTDWDEPSFVGVVEHCDLLFSGDTMALHVAVARSKPVVALFGPTCSQEIDLFGRGQKLVARVDCAPCYKRVCDQNDVCMDAIGLEQAVEAVLTAMPARR